MRDKNYKEIKKGFSKDFFKRISNLTHEKNYKK